MLHLRPDLVILLPSQRETAAALERAGVATLEVPHETLGDVERAIRLVAHRVGAGGAGDSSVARLRAGLARATSRQLATTTRPRVLFVVSREVGQMASLTAAGRGSYVDELISLGGGTSVLRESPVRYPELTAESVLRLQPHVVLEWAPRPLGQTHEKGDVPAASRLARVSTTALRFDTAVVHVLHDDSGSARVRASRRHSTVLHRLASFRGRPWSTGRP